MRKGAKHYASDGKRSEKGRNGKPKKSENDPSADLLKLKKKDLLEIMLKQGEEIDSLRARISDLEAQLESREINMLKSGSIAEASLALTKVFEEAQKAGVDFQLSGHTHEGQVWPISLIVHSMYENAWGFCQKGDTRYYVSSGIGIWGGKYRIGTRSEYIVATIQRQN